MQPKDLAEFILYVVPGFIAIETYRFVHPAKKRHHIYGITWSVFWGLFISSFIKYIFNLYKLEFGLNIWTSSAILITSALAGLIGVYQRQIRFAMSLHYEKVKWLFPPWLIPDSQTIWAAIQEENKSNWVVVFLNDGSSYFGKISRYTFDPDLDSQDFLLSNASRLKENNEIDYEISGLGVYLQTRDVVRVEYFEGSYEEKIKEPDKGLIQSLLGHQPALIPVNENKLAK